jgi:DNA-binding transcriptional LysR family regulator
VPRSKIELRHVRYIIAAAECGSFRRAAQDLGVEQSAISRRIRDVEDEIGAQLFCRHSAGVELTEIGKQFLNQVSRGARQIGSALDSARTIAATERHLRVGTFGPLTMGFLSELFCAFRRDRPDTRLRFSEASSPELVVAVRRGQLDVGIVAETSPGRGYTMIHLWNEPVYLAMPMSDPLADLRVVRWHDLRDRHFVVTDLPTGDFARAYLEQHLEGAPDDLHIEQLAVTRESLMQIVAYGGGVTIAGSAHVRLGLSGIAFRPIKDTMLRYGAVYSSGSLQRDIEHLLVLAKSLSERDLAWFVQQSLIRPEHQRELCVDRFRGARGRTPDRLQ